MQQRKQGILLMLLLLLLVASINSTIVHFGHRQLVAGDYIYVRHGMYTKQDLKSLLPLASQLPVIRLDLSITEASAEITNEQQLQVQLAIFHSDDLPFIGKSNADHTQVLCGDQNTLNVDQTKDRLFYKSVQVPAHVKHTYDITKSGIYYLLLVSCDTSVNATFSVNGVVKFFNPYGYLDAEEVPLMPFFGILAVFYVVTAFVWTVLNVLNWRTIVKLQMAISGVLFLGMVETMAYYIHYFEINAFGEFSPFLLTVCTFASIFRKAAVRILVLTISLGYGIMKEHLGETSMAIYVYGIIYFICSCMAEINTNLYSKLKTVSPTTSGVFVFPVIAVDVMFYFWLFVNISKTVRQLTIRKQGAKLSMYNSFKYVLVAYFGFCILWAIYQFYQQLMEISHADKQWDSKWAGEAFWHLLYFLAFVGLMLVFRPANNNVRFEHASQPVHYEGLAAADPEELETLKSEDSKTDKPEDKKPASPTNSSYKTTKRSLEGFGLGDDEEEEEPAKVD